MKRFCFRWAPACAIIACLVSTPVRAQLADEWIMVIWEHGQPSFDNHFPSYEMCETIRRGRIHDLSTSVSPEAIAREKEYRLTFPNNGIAQDFMDEAVKQLRSSEPLSPRQSEAISVLEAIHPSAQAEQQRLEALEIFKRHTVCDYHPTHPFRDQSSGPSTNAK